MITEVSKMKAEYLEEKLKIDKDKAIRTLEMKAEVDDK
jgi:hypothetical protein